MEEDNPRFVVDTHALWWYLRSPERLSIAAAAVFRLAETGNAIIVVPAIVVAEFYFLSAKLGQPLVPAELLDALSSVGGIELSDLGRAQLENLDGFPEISEMHDKLIAAESIVLDAPVVSRDEKIAASARVASVW
ncbi:MAG: type II toxin-antitoxin system VapC family toxin [Dehalococcoidia bacterium]|nr:type II toxin-antitoxin system VapC family toxin [Dehalococcoidia bacterium]